MADVVRQAVSTAVARLDANEPALWTERDPEAVHQARVATRRLRSDLRTFARLRRRDLGDAPARRAAVVRRRARARCATSKCCGNGCAGHAALLPDAEADGGARRDPPARRRPRHRAHRAPPIAPANRATRSCTARCTTPSPRPRLTTAAGKRATDALTRRGACRCGASCAARSTRSDRCPPTPRFTRSVSGRSGAATRPKRRRPGDRPTGPRLRRRRWRGSRTCWASIRTPWSPTAGWPRPRPSARPPEAYALGMLAEIERGLAVRARAAFRAGLGSAPEAVARAWL